MLLPRSMLATCAIALALPSWAAPSQSYEPGKSYFDENRYIEFIPGNMPLVITAPHGGTLRPFGIPDRSAGNSGCPRGKPITVSTDADSDALTRELQQSFFATYGARPHVVIAHISRRKLDLNRDIDEAACGNSDMQQTWRQWHAFVQEAVTAAIARFGGALYIDLHGHGHSLQRMELGYGLGGVQLAALYGKSAPAGDAAPSNQEEEDSVPVQAGETPRSTLANLPAIQEGKVSLHDMLFGDNAFGTLAASAGLNAVPGKQDPHPQTGEPFFNGGYNARRYTGKEYSQVFGWQIEVHRSARQAGARAATSRALMQALTEFMTRNTTLQWRPAATRP